MTGQNSSALLLSKKTLQLMETEIPQPKEGEVQVRVHSVGICGSDIHRWKNMSMSGVPITGPLILGHEASGTIVALGEGVQHFKVGDRVALEPGVPCLKCGVCKGGRYNLCPDIKFCSDFPTHGFLQRYCCHRADFCYKLPDSVSFEEGALLEPLSVAVYACRRGGVAVGHKVLLCGAGPIGLANMLTAKAMGAAAVCLTDVSESRLQVAKQMGADCTVLVNSTDSQEVASAIHDALGGPSDVTIECSGSESGVQAGLAATKSGGVFVLVGLGTDVVPLKLVKIVARREIDIRGVQRYQNCYPTSLAMVASGSVNVKQLVTHRFKLEQVSEAFDITHTQAGGAIKVLIQCEQV